MTATTLLADFTLALAQSGIERDTLLYALTDAETVALLTPLLDKARAAGAAEMQERCAVIAEETDTGWFDARTFTAQKIAASIRSLT